MIIKHQNQSLKHSIYQIIGKIFWDESFLGLQNFSPQFLSRSVIWGPVSYKRVSKKKECNQWKNMYATGCILITKTVISRMCVHLTLCYLITVSTIESSGYHITDFPWETQIVFYDIGWHISDIWHQTSGNRQGSTH